METITSRSNPLITLVRKLANDRKARRQSRTMVCEGPKMLEEALRWGAELTTLLLAQGIPVPTGLPEHTRVVTIPGDLLKSVAPTQTPQDLLFLCTIPAGDLPDELPGKRYLVLDGVQDPGNVGTLWRTADAFGADGLVLLPGCADPWSPKTIRATMGACFRLPMWSTSLEALQAACEASQLPLYATALREDTMDLRQVKEHRAALVIGSEGSGVTQAVLDGCQGTIKIPMVPRCESLNAAVAGAVVLWELGKEDL